MHALPLVQRLHAHRACVNDMLLAAARALPPAHLQQALSIGQGSVWRSLLHMYAAEYVWLATLEGETSAVLPGDAPDKLPGNQQAGGGVRSLDELAAAWKALEARWDVYLSGLDAAALDETVWKVSSNGRRACTARADILLHVCTHAHYTAAQVINMLRQLGVASLPDPMLITLARQEWARRSE